MPEWMAIPTVAITLQEACLNSNLERPGTIGTLSGTYQSFHNLRRYLLNRHAEPGTIYRVYRKNTYSGEWIFADAANRITNNVT